jgi:hypothetical protein
MRREHMRIDLQNRTTFTNNDGDDDDDRNDIDDDASDATQR